MAPGITSEDFGGKLKVFDTGKKLYIITETPWYFWLTTIFFVLALVSIPYLLYLMYDYYEKIPEANKTEEDKKYFNGGIAMTIILSISIIAVIVGFIVTEARKNGAKLDREQLEDYGKSLIVKGVAVDTAKRIRGEGTQYIDETSKLLAAKVVNNNEPQKISNWINMNKQEKQKAIDAAIEQYKKEQSEQTQAPAAVPETPAAVPETPAAVPETPAAGAGAGAGPAAVTETPAPAPVTSITGERENEIGETALSPISLSRSYKRRKSPIKKKKASPIKKKKASPAKKKSTSSKRK